MGKPKLIDPSLYKQAGIDLKTGKPTRAISGDVTRLRDNLRKMLRIIDEQDAVTRYKWYNLPLDISSEEFERLMYYKGQLCFFYYKELDKFFVMPFALDGSIDFYGRYNTIHPVPMSSGTEEEKDEKIKKLKSDQRALLSMLKLKVVKAVKTLDELTEEDLYDSAVILWDYTRQLGQNIIPRVEVNEPLLEVMAEIPCFLRTSLLAATGIKGMRVADADAKKEVEDASAAIYGAALTGELATPITSAVEIQELFDGPQGKSEEYLIALQALENLRLSTYGLENGGIFEKKAHKLQGEQDMNTANVGLVYADGLAIRQNFCNIVNSIWGTNIWCMPSESVLGIDVDGDGDAQDSNLDGQNSGVETSTPSTEEQGGQ